MMPRRVLNASRPLVDNKMSAHSCSRESAGRALAAGERQDNSAPGTAWV